MLPFEQKAKTAMRADANPLIEAFLASGGQVTRCRMGAHGKPAKVEPDESITDGARALEQGREANGYYGS